uniref:Uncharacterized protein n=1 Tax=Romanomermis culicivorax TaxID=13658 RepID=A0A915JL63_ROMCU
MKALPGGMEKRLISRKRSRGMENVYDIRVEYLPKTSFVEKFGDFLERRNSLEDSAKIDDKKIKDNNIPSQSIFDLENLCINSMTPKKLFENSKVCESSVESPEKTNFLQKARKNEKSSKSDQISFFPIESTDAKTVEQLWRSRSKKIEDTRHLLQNLEKLVEKQGKNKKRTTTVNQENNESDAKRREKSLLDPSTIHDNGGENRSSKFVVPLKSELIRRSATLNGFDVPSFVETSSHKRFGIKHCQSLVDGKLVQEKEPAKSVVGAKLRRLIWKISGRNARSADVSHVHQKSAAEGPRDTCSAQSTLDYGQIGVNAGRHHHHHQQQQNHLVKRYTNDSYEYYLDKGTKMMFHKNGDFCEKGPKKGGPNVVELYEIRSAPNSLDYQTIYQIGFLDYQTIYQVSESRTIMSTTVDWKFGYQFYNWRAFGPTPQMPSYALGRKVNKTENMAETCSLDRERAVKNDSFRTTGKMWPCHTSDILRRQNFFARNRPRSMPVLRPSTIVAPVGDDFHSSPAPPLADDFYWSSLDEKSKASYQKMTRANYKRMTSLCYDLLATSPPLDINEDVYNRRRICSSKWDDFSICSNGPIIVTDSTVLYLGKLDYEVISQGDETHQERILFMITRLFSNVKFYDSDDNEKIQLPFKPPSLITFTEHLPLSMIRSNSKEDSSAKSVEELSPESQNSSSTMQVKTALCKIHVLPYCLTITLAQFIDDFAESQIYLSNEQKFRSIVQFLMIQLINILIYLTNEQIFALPKKFDDFFVQVRSEKSLPHLFLNLDLSKLKIVCKFSDDHQNADFVPLNRCCLIILRALLKSDRRFLPIFFEKMPNKSKILDEFRQKYDFHFLKAMTNVVEILNFKENSLIEVKSVFEILHFACPTINNYNVRKLCDDFFVKLWLDEQRAKFLDFSHKFSTNFQKMAPETDLAENIYKRSFLLNCTILNH